MIRFFTAAMLAGVIAAAPTIASAMESNSPSAPSSNQQTAPSGNQQTAPAGSQKAKKPKTGSGSQKNSALEDFYSGWHKAYALVYDKGDYAGGIAVLRGMSYDNNPDVATLIGYASRKLGRYDDAKFWYDKALAADPDHALTWSYYGMWHAEQGNLLKAKDDLEKVRTICGTECKEYVALRDVIDGTRTY